MHPDDRDWVLLQANKRAPTSRPFAPNIASRAGWSVRWVRDEARFVYDAERRALYQHGIMLDITTYKRLEQEYVYFMGEALGTRTGNLAAGQKQAVFADALRDAAAFLK